MTDLAPCPSYPGQGVTMNAIDRGLGPDSMTQEQEAEARTGHDLRLAVEQDRDAVQLESMALDRHWMDRIRRARENGAGVREVSDLWDRYLENMAPYEYALGAQMESPPVVAG